MQPDEATKLLPDMDKKIFPVFPDQHNLCCHTSMNFWEFKEDHSRGYYLPVSNKAARNQGRQFVSGLLFLLANLFRLAGIMLVAVCSLLFMTFRLLWKSTKS
jgi:hypothetical protein